MKKRTRVATIILAASPFVSGLAQAGIPVFDAVNATSNIIQNFQLASIKHSLTYQGPGTINNHTYNIDKTTNNIAVSATHIQNSTNNIDKSTTSIDNSIKFNTEINADLTWIIAAGGDEEVPIPRQVSEKLTDILDGRSSDDYALGFQSASYYGEGIEDFGGAGVEGSRARKAANDSLVKAIEVGQESLREDADLLVTWRRLSDSDKSKGHGRQLQIANALAGSQVSQLMKLRAAMLVSEASRAAEAQAAADKDARAIATGIAMREGLDDLRSQTIAPQPKY